MVPESRVKEVVVGRGKAGLAAAPRAVEAMAVVTRVEKETVGDPMVLAARGRAKKVVVTTEWVKRAAEMAGAMAGEPRVAEEVEVEPHLRE